jgi:hypothetical protein
VPGFAKRPDNMLNPARWTSQGYASGCRLASTLGGAAATFVLEPVLHVDRSADNVPWTGGKTAYTGINRCADNALEIYETA